MNTTEVIRKFHITSRYKGYPLIIYAVELSVQKYGGCIKITKDIYPELSTKYDISIYSVERNIRTIIEACWKNNKEYVRQIVGYNCTKCPSNSEFIDAMAYYILHNNE